MLSEALSAPSLPSLTQLEPSDPPPPTPLNPIDAPTSNHLSGATSSMPNPSQSASRSNGHSTPPPPAQPTPSPLTRQQLLQIGACVAAAVRTRRIAFQQLFVLADAAQEVRPARCTCCSCFNAVEFTNSRTHSLQGLAAPEHMAHAFTRAGTQGIEYELLVQFAREIAGDDGLISIHDM